MHFLRVMMVGVIAAAVMGIGSFASAEAATSEDRLAARMQAYLDLYPGARKVSRNEIEFPGGKVVIGRSTAHGGSDGGFGVQKACSQGYLCLTLEAPDWRDWEHLYYYYCGTYALPNWVGYGYYENMQTQGTVARFYNRDKYTLWTSTAWEVRHNIHWTPVWYVKPC